LSRRQCFSALAATAATVGTLGAQQPAEKNIRSITRFYVKPDRVADFPSILKEFLPVFSKAGHKVPSDWWRSETGPSEFVVVSHHAKWSELDNTGALKEVAADLAPLRARMRQCLERSERIIDLIMPECSIRSSKAEVPSVVSVIRRRIKPEHVEDYIQAVKTEIMPAMKKAEIPTSLLTRTLFGEPGPVFRRSTPVKSWAQIDEPDRLTAAMGGPAAMQKFVTRLEPWIIENENQVYSRIPELDYKGSV